MAEHETAYSVRYGAKNDGPKVQTFGTDKEAAEAFANGVGGTVKEHKPRP